MERGANGETYLRVSSPALMNEPYLDLMVEVNWSGGRVVRDYTFLLDPPGMAAEVAQVEPVTPPRAGSAAPRAPRARFGGRRAVCCRRAALRGRCAIRSSVATRCPRSPRTTSRKR